VKARFLFAIGSILSASAGAAAAPAPQVSEFTVGTQQLLVEAPAGYCLPNRMQQAVVQVMGAGDPESRLVASFFRCGSAEDETDSSDYILIKAPNQTLLMNLEKASALTMVDEVLGAKNTPLFDPAMQAEAAADFNKGTGLDMSFSGTTIGYAGRDEDCVYLGGTVVTSSGSAKIRVHAFSCMTVVGGKMLALTAYGPAEKRPLVELKAISHALALAVKPQ
jgi:hypothetical protein